MRFSRRSILMSGAAFSAGGFCGTAVPRYAHAVADPATASLSLKVAQAALGMVASRHAAEVQANQMSAIFDLLQSVSNHLIALNSAVARLIEAVNSLPNEMREALTEFRDNELNRRVLGTYASYLEDKSTILRTPSLWRNKGALDEFSDKCDLFREQIRSARNQIVNMRRPFSTVTAATMAAALRAELDIILDLEGMRRASLNRRPTAMNTYATYFSNALDVSQSVSLGAEIMRLTEALSGFYASRKENSVARIIHKSNAKEFFHVGDDYPAPNDFRARSVLLERRKPTRYQHRNWGGTYWHMFPVQEYALQTSRLGPNTDTQSLVRVQTPEVSSCEATVRWLSAELAIPEVTSDTCASLAGIRVWPTSDIDSFNSEVRLSRNQISLELEVALAVQAACVQSLELAQATQRIELQDVSQL